MKDPLLHDSHRMLKGPVLPRHGVVLAAICHMSTSLPRILVGVRRSLTPGPWLVCLHTPVARLVRELGRGALIHAMQLAMLAHVLLALQWGLLRTVSVAVTRPPNDAKILIIRMVGAAEKYVATFCHAVNTHVLSPVMKDFVVRVRSRSMRVVTAVKWRQKCCVVRRMMNWIVKGSKRMDQMKNGLDALVVQTRATVLLIVGCISARRIVILKLHFLRTALALLMLFLAAPAAKLDCLKFRDMCRDQRAKTLSPIASNLAAKCLLAVTLAIRSAIPDLVVHACAMSQSHVNVVATRP